jgi:hypothetical protein
MKNPSLEIPLSDDESHISLPPVAQDRMMAATGAESVSPIWS